MKPIEYIRAIKQELCPHCVPNLPWEDGATRMVCGKANISWVVVPGLEPCTLADWEKCPLNGGKA